MTPKTRKICVALGLWNIPIATLIQQSRHFVISMTGNPNFPSPSPDLASVTTQIDALENAYGVSLTRVMGSVSTMHTEARQLRFMLHALGAYVQNIANVNTAFAQEIIASAGMNEKKPIQRKPKEFNVKNGRIKGSVELNMKAVVHGAYIYQMSVDPANDSGWNTICISTRVKFIQAGLKSGGIYYFRSSVVSKGVQGNWSNVLEVMVI